MTKGKVLKIAIDIAMTIILILLMGYSFTGNLAHEILGITIFILFILHCILNIKWFMQMADMQKGKSISPIQIIWIVVNLLLVVDMIVLMISSMIISRSIFNFINVSDMSPWTYMHKVTAYSGFVLISMHLGLHWNMIMAMGRKLFSIQGKNIIRTTILRILALVLAIMGVKSSFDRGIALKFIPNTKTSSGINEESKDERTEYQKEEKQNISNDKTVTNDTSNSNFQLVSQSTEMGRPEGHGGRDGKESADRTFTETIEDGESSEDFLGRLICTGCGKQCSLLSPQCGRGEQQAEQAIEYYNNYDSQGSSTTESEENTDSSESSNSSENSDTSSQNIEEKDSSSASTKQDDSTSADDTTTDESGLKDYLGGLYCDGCGKHCSLLTPKCNVGQEKAQEATQEYNEQNGETSTQENSENQSNASEAEQSDNSVVIKADEESFTAVFGDYIPIMGLYIAGTHYTLELINKRGKKKKEQSKEDIINPDNETMK